MSRLASFFSIAVMLLLTPSISRAQTLAIPGVENASVTFNPNDTRITAAQKTAFAEAYAVALQQVNAGLQYLEISRDRILSGQDEIYNRSFGRFYDTTANNPLLGSYDQGIEALLVGERIGVASAAAANSSTITFPADTIWRNNIEPGDQIVIDGRVRTVITINITQVNIEDNGAGIIPKFYTPEYLAQGDEDVEIPDFEFPELRSFILDRPLGPIAPTDLRVFSVEGETTVPDPSHYFTVVNQLEEIREMMMDNTNVYADLNLAQAQAIYNTIFDPAVDIERINGSAFTGDFLNDLRTRFAGLSNSLSQAHLNQIQNNPNDPLLWTEDGTFLANGNIDPAGVQTFIENYLTAIARQTGTADPEMLIGQAFLNQLQQNAGPLLNGDPSQATRPTQAMYQMIIAAFAEMTDDGAFGISDLYNFLGSPNGTPLDPFPQNRDAATLASFLDVMTDPQAGTGIGDGTRLPPPGKQTRINDDDEDVFIPFIPFN